MSSTNLAIKVLLIRNPVLLQVRGMILAHVMFKRVAVGLLRWLPSRLLSTWVEVVREVLAIGVPDLLERCEKSIRLEFFNKISRCLPILMASL